MQHFIPFFSLLSGSNFKNSKGDNEKNSERWYTTQTFVLDPEYESSERNNMRGGRKKSENYVKENNDHYEENLYGNVHDNVDDDDSSGGGGGEGGGSGCDCNCVGDAVAA